MNKYLYENKKIELYPGDSNLVEGIIVSVDELGWIIKITRVVNRVSYSCGYSVGDTIFISISTPFKFKYIEENK